MCIALGQAPTLQASQEVHAVIADAPSRYSSGRCGMADLGLGFSVDARPDGSVKRQLSQKDGKARRKREQGQAEREAKLAKLIFQDESLVDELDEPALPKSKRRGRAPVQASEDGDDEEQQEEGEEGDDEEEGEEDEEDEEPPLLSVGTYQ